jgi:hypothetical protein
MVATISFNPMITSNAAGSFNVSSEGYIQGTALNDPNVRNQLAGGVLADTETLPMWGGVGIGESLLPSALGGKIARATYLGGAGQLGGGIVAVDDGPVPLTGFSVFDQNAAANTTPQSPVPLSGSRQLVNFYRFGSNARIVVKADPILADLAGASISPQVSWDLKNQLLVPFEGSTTNTISSGTYNNTTGALALTLSATPVVFPGDSFTLSALTGTGAFASLNGTYTALSVVGNVVTAQATAGLGAATITGGTLTPPGTVALPVRVLDLQVGNCMTVDYDPTTGFATWNRNGTCAVILI